MRIPFAWVVALSLLTACQPPIPSTGVPTLIPTASPAVPIPALTATPASVPPTFTPLTRSRVTTTEANHRIEIALFDTSGRTAATADIGSTISLVIAFRPYRDVITQWSDGASTRYSEGWPPEPGVEMQFCAGLQKGCALADKWVPFAKEQRVSVLVNWIGVREYKVTAQFRDAKGKLIPAGLSSTDTASNSMPINGVVNDRTPIVAQPATVQTAVAQARAVFPITGGVTVGTGSAMGGKAGSNIDIPVRFQANSSFAPVSEMRVKLGATAICLDTLDMSDAVWETFSPTKTYTYRAAINWTTFGLNVQYRDAQGNLSPVYCGEIPVEGNP